MRSGLNGAGRIVMVSSARQIGQIRSRRIDLRKIWSVPLGPSYSGPIVVGDRVFTTETLKRKSEACKSIRREDWKTALVDGMARRNVGSFFRQEQR